MKAKYKEIIIYMMNFIFVVIYIIMAFDLYKSECHKGMETDTVRLVSYDTLRFYHHDTIPKVVKERIVRFVPVPAKQDTINSASGPGTDSIPVVQKEYTDDSTYTAWVSGLSVNDYPRLDSISIIQRQVTERITETVNVHRKTPRWGFGLQAGYGFGISSRKFEPYIGLGVSIGF